LFFSQLKDDEEINRAETFLLQNRAKPVALLVPTEKERSLLQARLPSWTKDRTGALTISLYAPGLIHQGVFVARNLKLCLPVDLQPNEASMKFVLLSDLDIDRSGLADVSELDRIKILVVNRLLHTSELLSLRTATLRKRVQEMLEIAKQA
jgi:hypothetical protein